MLIKRRSLKKNARRFWRALPAGARKRLVRVWQDRFTASVAAIVRNGDGKILLLNHILRPYSGWGFPGGFIDHGEQAEDAIRRELDEETGIVLYDLELFRVRIVGAHVEILYRARTKDTARVNSSEIIELGWFAADDLPKDLSKTQAAMIREILETDG